MTQLCFTTPKFTENLSYCHAFNSTFYKIKFRISKKLLTQKSIPLRRASRYPFNLLSALEQNESGLEALAFNLLSNFIELLSLYFGDSFDVEHLFLSTANFKLTNKDYYLPHEYR
jgi:hypothetical protein